jgi:hypothetical protein
MRIDRCGNELIVPNTTRAVSPVDINVVFHPVKMLLVSRNVTTGSAPDALNVVKELSQLDSTRCTTNTNNNRNQHVIIVIAIVVGRGERPESAHRAARMWQHIIISVGRRSA